ncbi:MAG: HAMP domain-containing sensor histidine kinase [Planctomycetia bacterium]|nr:HAMP domain-containing sensor histidine kinase [Planctomycetia bacterium]
MTRRDVFLYCIPLMFGLLGLLSGFLLWFQHTHFEQTYLTQEQKEISNNLAMMVEYFRPLLETNDLEAMDRFCETFAFDERSITILDSKGNAIATSPNANLHGSQLELPEVERAMATGTGAALRCDSRTGIWTLHETAAVDSRGKRQYIRVSIPTKNVSNVLNDTAKVIFCVSLLVTLTIGIFSWYLIRYVSRPLTRLQRSAERIAAGDIAATVEVPEQGVIRELALSIAQMAAQLNKELANARKQELFRREFIANISHEIKTPLTGILSAVEFLTEDENVARENQIKCMEILSQQAHRLNALVGDILNLSELEQMEEGTDFVPVRLNDIITRAVALCEGAASENHCRLRVQCQASTVVIGHARMLEQAVVNLIANAVKYSGSPEVEISLVDDSNFLHILVRDWGIGIPEEDAERIFERFYRLRREYGSNRDGTGLGLAIVKRIALIHHGTISLDPQTGQGAIFRLSLPVPKKGSLS